MNSGFCYRAYNPEKDEYEYFLAQDLQSAYTVAEFYGLFYVTPCTGDDYELNCDSLGCTINVPVDLSGMGFYKAYDGVGDDHHFFIAPNLDKAREIADSMNFKYLRKATRTEMEYYL